MSTHNICYCGEIRKILPYADTCTFSYLELCMIQSIWHQMEFWKIWSVRTNFFYFEQNAKWISLGILFKTKKLRPVTYKKPLFCPFSFCFLLQVHINIQKSITKTGLTYTISTIRFFTFMFFFYLTKLFVFLHYMYLIILYSILRPSH